MMEKAKFARRGRAWSGWIAVILTLSVLSLTSACVFNEDDGDDGPESTTGWSWEDGSDITGAAGVYGTKGVASSSNYPGGRGYHLAWQDPSGLLWLFGGHGIDSAGTEEHLNDLWKYSPATGEWTWISGSNTVSQSGTYGTKGTPAPGNVPGARDSYSLWRDSSGRLWLFGGYGFDSTSNADHLNDLWMFDPGSSEWTWISGSSRTGQAGVYGVKGTSSPDTHPGARYRADYWIDPSGDFWLFGGLGLDADGLNGELNDLWRFDPETLRWTWISGSDARNPAGIYGTKGSPAAGNVPGGRDAGSSWLDGNGRLWLYGGTGCDASGTVGWLSDMWVYDQATNEWAWMSGANAVNQPGVYGTQGTASASNNPGGLDGAMPWLDPGGKFWLFGGSGLDESGDTGLLDDIWKYDPTTFQWTWMAGSKNVNQTGDLSSQGKRYLSNNPGAREHAAVWIDSAGNLWLIGGRGYGSRGSRGYLNDMWEYVR